MPFSVHSFEIVRPCLQVVSAQKKLAWGRAKAVSWLSRGICTGSAASQSATNLKKQSTRVGLQGVHVGICVHRWGRGERGHGSWMCCKTECYLTCGACFRLAAPPLPVQIQQPGIHTHHLSRLCKIRWLTAEGNDYIHLPPKPQCDVLHSKKSQRKWQRAEHDVHFTSVANLITRRTTRFTLLSFYIFRKHVAALQAHSSSKNNFQCVVWGQSYCMCASGMCTLSGAQIGTLGTLTLTVTLDTGCATIGCICWRALISLSSLINQDHRPARVTVFTVMKKSISVGLVLTNGTLNYCGKLIDQKTINCYRLVMTNGQTRQNYISMIVKDWNL